jgi:hypothetical protein
MGYTRTREIGTMWTPTNDVILTNDDINNPDFPVYTKIKEMTIIREIYPVGTIRFAFDMYSHLVTVYGKIYKNGVAVGVEKSNGLHDDTWHTYTDDVAFTDLAISDTLELWAYLSNSKPNEYIRNFRLCGRADQNEVPFYNTMT